MSVFRGVCWSVHPALMVHPDLHFESMNPFHFPRRHCDHCMAPPGVGNAVTTSHHVPPCDCAVFTFTSVWVDCERQDKRRASLDTNASKYKHESWMSKCCTSLFSCCTLHHTFKSFKPEIVQDFYNVIVQNLGKGALRLQPSRHESLLWPCEVLPWQIINSSSQIIK